MARNGMVPPVTLKGARVPISRLAAFAPHTVQMKTDEETGARVPDWDPPNVTRTATPAAREAAVQLARKSRAVVRTARPFEHPIIPGRRVG